MKLIIMGAPGAGKGTQAEILSEKLGIPTISTGNILRAAVRDGTPVGRKAKALIEAGSLVSDDVIIGILNERLGHEDCANGYILDGVPRTLAQADMLHAEGVEVDAVIDIDVSDGAIEKRMTGRRTCSGCSATYHVAFNPP
ncbi:MAG: nucleoside monophosphate kinase, partial [Oscillospiraceae bacterium]|nr:nucleoside monophosphate kinase [Oscillospiraceae bacterium]